MDGGQFGKNSEIINTWIRGLGFLYESQTWPEDTSCEETRRELRKEYEATILVTATDATENFDWTTINFQPAEFTTYTTLNETLLELIRGCQTESFGKDIKRVKEGKELHR